MFNSKNVSTMIIILTFTLLLLGGLVHNTQSSLACPDWPLCYGQVFPKMEGGILIEHSHRLLASLVGLLTIVLVVINFLNRHKNAEHMHLYRVSFFSLFAVILQGILGGITVIYRLPTIVSTTHLALSQIYFLLIVYIHHKSSRTSGTLPYKFLDSFKDHFKTHWKPFIRHGVLLALALLYLQIVLGAFMRHSGAGASCGLGPHSSLLCMDITKWTLTAWPSMPAAQLHMAHRIYALIVTFAIFIFAFKVKRFFYGVRYLVNLCYLPMLLIAIQVGLGIYTVYSNMAVVPTTLHLGFASLSLAALWKLNLCLRDFELGFFLSKSDSGLSDLLDLTKPKLSLLVMMTVFIGLVIAPGHINFFKALLSFFSISLVVIGSATLNCFIEKEVDKEMERTKDRPLPSKRMSPRLALIFGFATIVTGGLLLFLAINPLTSYLSLIAALLYLYAYTPMKLKSPSAVYVGAIPGAIPPVLGYTTVTGELNLMAWVLFGILFIWQLPHFLAISIFHAEDYKNAGIQIFPNKEGAKKTVWYIFVFTLLLVVVSLLPSYLKSVSIFYGQVALVIGILFLIYSTKGFFHLDDLALRKSWAKNYFYGSIFYLPLLLSALIFFK